MLIGSHHASALALLETVTADVNCFDISGNPILADFSLFEAAGPAATSLGAYAWANQPDRPQLCCAPRRRESPVEEGSIQIVVGLIW
jgi:hypothetical protein